MDWSLAESLAIRFGTPYYAYDLDDIERRYAELSEALPTGSQLFYSLKANPMPSIAAVLKDLGCRAEVSSPGELAVALDVGFDPRQVLYTGPGKTPAEIEAAVAARVGTFSAESHRDLALLSAIATRTRRAPAVLARVNPDHLTTAGLAMAGRPSQFGFDEFDLLEHATEVWSTPGLDMIGTHTYLGTQLALDSICSSFEVGLGVGERIGRQWEVRIVDLGGGFPWPFASKAPIGDLIGTLAEFRRAASARGSRGLAELWFESGRYLVASSGTLVSRVVDVRTSRGVTMVVLDAGIAHLGGMSGLGRMLAPAVSIQTVADAREGAIRADVVGPLCTPLDCLARAALVPHVSPGELVAIANVGAYGATASLTGFLSRPSAVEITLRGGRPVDAARLRTGHAHWSTSVRGRT